MRYLFVFFICCTSFLSKAQDSLFFKNGSVKAVQIVEMDTVANIIRYASEGDTVYAAVASFERIVYSGKAISFNRLVFMNGINDTIKVHDPNPKRCKAQPRHIYGKWALATNLTGIFQLDELINYSANSVFSIEPEYFINNQFSIKLPIHFGHAKFDEDFTENPFQMVDLFNTNELIHVQKRWSKPKHMGHARNLLFQVGLNPKFHPQGHRPFGWYVSQGFYLSQIDLYRTDYYFSYKKQVIADGLWWGNPIAMDYETFEEKRWIFRYEGAIGLSLDIFRRLGLTTEIGYTTLIKEGNENPDRVFISVDEGDYVLDPFLKGYATSYKSGQFINPYIRIHLVYRLGGERNNDPLN